MDKIIPQYRLYDYKIERNDMNKYEEALEILIETNHYSLEKEEVSDSVDTLQELIDKTTPKKVMYEEGKNIYGGLVRICPSCKDKIIISPQAKEYEHYCRYCGQALWGDEDGK